MNLGWFLSVVMSITPGNFYVPDGAFHSALSGGVADSLTISLATPANPYGIGSPIIVEMVLKNGTKSPVRLNVEGVPHSEYYGYRFTLTKDQKIIPKTNFHKALGHEDNVTDPEVPMGGSSDVYLMPPGASTKIPIDLKRLFNITELGDYEFSVEMLRTVDSKTPIYGGPVLVRIVQGP